MPRITGNRARWTTATALLAAGASILPGNFALAQQAAQGNQGAQGNQAPQGNQPALPLGLPTGTNIPNGQNVLPPGGGPSLLIDPRDPNTKAGLQIQLSTAVQEILTDNARGVAGGGSLSANSAGTVSTNAQNKKEGDLISRFTPTLNVLDRTPRLEFGLNYAPSYDKYLNATDLDRFNNTLTATSNAELWQEHLALSTNASVSRQFINNQGAISGFGTNTGNNQTDVKTFTVSPTLTQRFGDFATGQLQYLLGYSDTGVLATTLQNTVSAQLTSPADTGPFFWNLQLINQQTDQSSQPNPGQNINGIVNPTTTANTTQRTAQLQTAYALNHTVSLLSGVGYEEIINSGLPGGAVRGPIGNFGIGLTGAKSQITLMYNLRYNGQYASFNGDFDLTQNLHLQGSYNESITTTQNSLINSTAGLGLSAGGNLINTQTGQAFNATNSAFGINSGLQNQIFHDKIGQATLTGSYDRNVYTFLVQREQREANLGFNETDTTVSGNYSRDISAATRYNLTVTYQNIDQEQPTSSRSDTYTFTTGFDYKFAETLTASAAYSFIYRKSNTQGQNLRENELLLGLRKDF